jgi:hypothetical protein
MNIAHIESITANLAQTVKQNISNHLTDKTTKKTSSTLYESSQICVLSLKPYQYGVYNTGMWHNILKNLSDIPMISVGIVGNSSSIRMILRIDTEDKKLIETILYTIYPDIGIEEIDSFDIDYEYFYFTPTAGTQRGDADYFVKQ